MTTEQQTRFDGRVAIVTGAGGSIGRHFALALAARGASVLVNDYGGDASGQSGTSAAADAVVDEIAATGGRAQANATPVGTVDAARSIVNAALQAFGRIDILVNNAAIMVNGRIDELSDHDVESMFRINLLGPYHLMRAVWPLMRQQRYGRILNVSSNSSMGIGGCAPYATTKAGLLGLSLDTAAEGRSVGVLVNALVPTANSRLTDQVPDPAVVAWYRKHMPPEKVAAAALHFLSRESEVTGQILSVGGGKLARVAFAEGRGLWDDKISPEAVRDHLGEALDMENHTLLFSQADASSVYRKAFPGGLPGQSGS